MISEQAIKERAMQIDPCAFKSYSSSSRREAQQEALARARRELEWDEDARARTVKCEKCGWSFMPPMKGGCDHKDCEYTTQQRRYTLNEIDRMRTAIKRVQGFNYTNRVTTGLPSIEDQLRTAMIGGVEPQELEAKADLYWEAIRERRAARQAIVRASNDAAHAEAIVADV